MSPNDREDPKPDRGNGPPDGKGRPVNPARPNDPGRPVKPHRSSTQAFVPYTNPS